MKLRWYIHDAHCMSVETGGGQEAKHRVALGRAEARVGRVGPHARPTYRRSVAERRSGDTAERAPGT